MCIRDRVYTDHVLVPYYNYEVKTKFTEEGIHYDQLSPEDKARYEDDFAEDDTLPTFIPSEKLNKFCLLYTSEPAVQGHCGCREHQRRPESRHQHQKDGTSVPCALPADAQNRRALRLHRTGRRFVRFQQGAPEHPKGTD